MANLSFLILIILLAGNPQVGTETQTDGRKQPGIEKAQAVRQAIEQCKKEVLENPHSAEAYLNLGLAYYETGTYDDDALRAFEQAVRLEPNLPQAYVKLAWLYNKRARFKDAVEASKRALSFKPDCAEAYLAMGWVNLSLDRAADAEEAFRQAIEFDPQNGDAHFSLANLFRDQQRYEEAIEVFNAGLRIKPDEIYMGLTRIGEIYMKLGSYEEAIKTYKDIIRFSPNSSTAYYHLGSVYVKLVDKK